jgi:carbon storage regulator CsrA
LLHLRRQLGETIMVGADCALTVVGLFHARRAAAILIGRPSSADADELETRTVELAKNVPHRITASISVTLAAVSEERAVLAVDAPKTVPVHRLEVYEAIRRKRREDDEGAGGAAVRRSPWPPGTPPSLDVRLHPPTWADDA